MQTQMKYKGFRLIEEARRELIAEKAIFLRLSVHPSDLEALLYICLGVGVGDKEQLARRIEIQQACRDFDRHGDEYAAMLGMSIEVGPSPKGFIKVYGLREGPNDTRSVIGRWLAIRLTFMEVYLETIPDPTA